MISQEHEQLLKACLWKKKIDISIDNTDEASYRMLPLLYFTLKNNEKLKGIYKHSWLKNQIYLQKTYEVIKLFHENEIPTMVLKGIALSIKYYEDMGVRPMSDFDIMVPKEKACQAVDLIQKNGWNPQYCISKSPKILEKTYINTNHSYGFKDSQGTYIDLHWEILPECCHRMGTELFWERADVIEVKGLKTLCLSPTDQLFHVCVHGNRWNLMPTIRWVADAFTILSKKENSIHWNLLIKMAKDYEVSLTLKNALKYLKEVMEAPIPYEVIVKLEKIKTSSFEKKEYRFFTSPQKNIKSEFLFLWYRHCRYFGIDKTWIKKIITLPSFFQKTRGLTSLWKVPLFLFRKTLKRSFRFLFG